MTELEKDSLDTFRMAIDHFAAGRRTGKTSYMAIMGAMRDMVRRLEKLMSGCPTGTHFKPCTCQPAVVGSSIDVIKQKRRKGLLG